MRVKKSLLRQKTCGWTLVELLAVIGILAALTGLLLPSIQAIRESSRRIGCLNKVRQLGLACLNFESSRQTLPSGTLGFQLVELNGVENLDWESPGRPGFWKNSQHTSMLVFLLPFIDETSVNAQMPQILLSERGYYSEYLANSPSAPAWIGNLPELDELKRTRIGALLCPSDSLNSVEQQGALAMVATQPCFEAQSGNDYFLGQTSSSDFQQPGGTNFLGNSGAHCVGDVRIERPGGFMGPFGSRRRIRMAQIHDGTSNIILLGENIGAIENGRRELFHSWMFGGLARGRGGLPWMSDVNPDALDYLILGDSLWSYPAGFGSMHPETVNFALGDGSAKSLTRLTHMQVIYNLCGISDGETSAD